MKVGPNNHGEVLGYLDIFDQEDWVFCLEALETKQLQMAFNAICKITEEREMPLVGEEI